MEGFDHTTNPASTNRVTADVHCASQKTTKSPAALRAAKFHAAWHTDEISTRANSSLLTYSASQCSANQTVSH